MWSAALVVLLLVPHDELVVQFGDLDYIAHLLLLLDEELHVVEVLCLEAAFDFLLHLYLGSFSH